MVEAFGLKSQVTENRQTEAEDVVPVTVEIEDLLVAAAVDIAIVLEEDSGITQAKDASLKAGTNPLPRLFIKKAPD